MNPSLLEYTESLRIGTVEFVSPDEIKVLLDIEAPDSVALNTGTPRPFPRVNSYVLIPSDEGYMVGQVEWLTIERSAYPKRRGMQDFGLVDLPYPSRKMSLNPLGTLYKTIDSDMEERYKFRRGADALPSVGDSVLLPTQQQLRSIVESGDNLRVKIGTSPLAGNADVCVDPDRLFGRHLAVLGNTGSGKSCSVAGLIRWSLEAAAQQNEEAPNARFIVLDPNGEYERAFADETGVLKPRLFKVEPKNDEKPLQVPLWFWNSAEWCSFTQASGKTQRPTLIYALRAVRDGLTEIPESASHDMRRFLRTLVSTIQAERNSGSPWGQFPKPKAFFEKINKWKSGLETSYSFAPTEQTALNNLTDKINTLIQARSGLHPNYDFTRQEIDDLIEKLREAHRAFGGSDVELLPVDADIPLKFSGDSLLRSLEASAEMLNVSEYVETMLIRIRTMLADSRMQPIIDSDRDITLDQWLTDYIGWNKAQNGCLTIIDLSLVPSEIIHIITAVIARMVFEALQRYRKNSDGHKVLPTVLVMEEAHTFIKRYKEDAENQDAASVCCQVFERIAREGRKFGLGLLLSSQRPSELSTTVLSQCNTFLIHRISNDRDQDLVHRFVPDNLKGLLRELPLLPTQNAILLGWASELPVLVRMNDLPKEQQPQSDDPDFWNVWTCKETRDVDWKKIADDWQGKTGNGNGRE
ncbi:MAG TPA: ATP-binding protein [Bacillota bacterium]|mgnify:CR=1 FL=1|nr:ATP-binding protein [Bacillota bacterium]